MTTPIMQTQCDPIPATVVPQASRLLDRLRMSLQARRYRPEMAGRFVEWNRQFILVQLGYGKRAGVGVFAPNLQERSVAVDRLVPPAYRARFIVGPLSQEKPMHIDQKRITTVNLLDGRAHDFILHKESWGYKFSSVSKDEVVNILLSPHDFRKLRQEIAEAERTDIKKLEQPLLEKRESLPTPAGTCIFQWSTGDWLSFN